MKQFMSYRFQPMLGSRSKQPACYSPGGLLSRVCQALAWRMNRLPSWSNAALLMEASLSV